MLGIEPELAACKGNALTAVLSFQPLGAHFLSFGMDIFLVDKDNCNLGFEDKVEIFCDHFLNGLFCFLCDLQKLYAVFNTCCFLVNIHRYG